MFTVQTTIRWPNINRLYTELDILRSLLLYVPTHEIIVWICLVAWWYWINPSMASMKRPIVVRQTIWFIVYCLCLIICIFVCDKFVEYFVSSLMVVPDSRARLHFLQLKKHYLHVLLLIFRSKLGSDRICSLISPLLWYRPLKML